ncbi:MAG: hypothetical protein ACTSRZ_02290 [Promethearchaeota archaeon]
MKNMNQKILDNELNGKLSIFGGNIEVLVQNHDLLRGNTLYNIELLKYEGFFFRISGIERIKEINSKLKEKEESKEKKDKIITNDRGITKKEIPKIIILIGPLRIERKYCREFDNFVRNGGGLIGIGNISGMEDIFGVDERPADFFPFPIGGIKYNSLGEGFLTLENKRLLEELDPDYFPLHGFFCTPVENDGAEIIGYYEPVSSSGEKWPAISLFKLGKGYSLYIGADIGYIIRYIQEGRYVDCDGIPPADGMAPINDGILKCEDGLVLDWKKDRRVIPGKYNTKGFIIPVADAWRIITRNCVSFLADLLNVPIKRVDYWPNGSRFIGMISHDTDGNDEKKALKFLNQINDLGIKTTWCLIPPGYSRALCKKIEDSGHELAFHFDAQSLNIPNIFSKKILFEQLKKVKKNTGISNFYSNKNHYTRWEGKIDFFLWLEEAGIKVDQSKGPTKCGTVGFPFGTAHPWQPLDNSGRLINCLEIGFQSQDIGLQGPFDIGRPLVDAVKKIRGVCHFIFHPAHYQKKEVQKNLKEIVKYIKDSGGKFMRSIDIGKWYSLRRKFIESLGKKKYFNESEWKKIKKQIIILERKDKNWKPLSL